MDISQQRVSRKGAIFAAAGLVGTIAALDMGDAQALARQMRLNQVQDTGADPDQDNDSQWEDVEAVFSTEGKNQPGGVFEIDLPRNDQYWTVEGYPVEPEWQFVHEFTFLPTGGSTAFLKYEIIALQGTESDPVLSSLLSQGVPFTAEHNHFYKVEPQVIHIHGWVHGDRVQIARAIRNALNYTSTPFGSGNDDPDSGSDTVDFDAKRVAAIIGGDGTVTDGVLDVTVPRKETITQQGVTLPPAMQVDHDFRFNSVGGGRVAAAGEFVLVATEVDTVATILRQHDIEVTALHNHELQINPMLFYLHSFAVGDPYSIADVFHQALPG